MLQTVGDTNLVHTELHTRTGPPMTPDSVLAIASNSKLFLAMSVGLLISNETLAEQRGEEIKWSTIIRDFDSGMGFDGWGDGPRGQLAAYVVPSDGYAKT